MAPLSTNILTGNQSSHPVKRPVIKHCGLAVIPTCLQEVKVIVCGGSLKPLIMKVSDRKHQWWGLHSVIVRLCIIAQVYLN